MMQIPITLWADEKGYFDRECPNEKCMYTFKILMKDWKEKVTNDEVHCPRCGHVDTADRWWTQGQLAGAKEIVKSWAISYLQTELDKTFREIARDTRNNKFFKLTYKPGNRMSFINNPIGQMKEWETEICCERCGTNYSVIGAAYFCPCCGYNSAVNAYNSSLENIRKMLDSLSEMRNLMTQKYDKDSAETMCRGLLESSIGDMISAFQKFASSRYEELSGKEARVNDFQIVDKGSCLFYKTTGKQYSDWLSESEIEYMQDMFQKRHILEHNNGIVDQKYINSVNNKDYSLGQRIVLKAHEAYALLDILVKLGNGLKSISIGENTDGNN